MKKQIKNAIISIMLLLIPALMFGQTPPNLGVASNFVLFTTGGAMTNTGISQLTGNVGTNNGAVTGFGNVNGVMTFTGDALSAPCAAALLIAYGELDAQVATNFPAPAMGGNTLNSGVHSISGATTLNGTLTLDAQGISGAVFIFQIHGPFSTAANSKIKLINGAQACNVFWQIEGEVNMASGTFMRGTIIANNAAIHMNAGDTLEGRALSIEGAVTLDGVMAYTPVGCGSTVLHGPIAPTLSSALCYAIFSASGPVTNTGVSFITGDVGTNVGLTSGFDALNVIGAIHPIPDGSTAAAAADLLIAYTYVNTLPADIELLYPAQFGNDLVLTPHTYVINGAVTFTNNIYLNAMGDSNAVFVIKTYGAFSTSTYSKVKLTNGTKAENVYWMVNGAVTINDYSEFNGTIICNIGAMNLNTGATINGRALTTTGAIETSAITAIMPPGCLILSSPMIITEPVNKTVCAGNVATFSVTATGSNLTYQWRKGIVDLMDGVNISGATTATLTINAASITDVASNYNVIVSGSSGPDVTSVNVSLASYIAPTITTQPSDQSACTGDSVSFIVVATGSNLTYQWRKGIVDLMDGVNISGATNDTLTINPASITDVAANYNVVVSGACAPDAISINKSLTLDLATTIITQPSDQSACTGDSVSFIVVATGSNLTYQWRKGIVNLIDGVNISGATNDTLTIKPISIADVASNYNVVVSGACAPDAISINKSLTLDIAPIIITEPSDITACTGDSVSFIVVATGSNLTYQWRKGIVDLMDGVNISGANSDTLIINPASSADVASNYNVVIGNGCSLGANSIDVSLELDVAPMIVTNPSDQAVCNGDLASFIVVATGSNLTYQWRKGIVDLMDGVNISGVNSDTLFINPALITNIASNYNVVVTGGCATVNPSTDVDLNSAEEFGILAGTTITSTGFSVISDMNVGLSPGFRTAIVGFPPAIVINGVIYAADDIAPPGVPAMLILAKQNLTDAYNFAAGASVPAPATVAGDQGGLTLYPGIYKSTSSLLIQSGDLTLDAQGDANATWIFQIASDFTTIGGAGGSVILAGGALAKNITWQVGSSATIGNGTSFKGNILALTSITMNTGSSIEGKLLAINGAVVFSGTNIMNSPGIIVPTTDLTSNNASLMVYPLPVANAGPDQTIALGGNVSIGTIAIVGNTYSWLPITDLSSALIAQPIASPSVNTTYVLTVSSTNGCTNTDTMTVFVTGGANNPPVAVNDTINLCENDGVTTINVQGNDSDPDANTLTTSIFTGALHGTSLLNGNAINYTPNTGFVGTDTIVYVICDNGIPSLCDTATVIIFVNPLPTLVITDPADVCSPETVDLTLAAVTAGSTAGLTFTYWTDNLATILYATPTMATAGTYYIMGTTALGCSDIQPVTITVNSLPVADAGPDQTIALGGNVSIGTIAIVGNTYSWLPITDLSSAIIAQPIASPSVNTTYVLTVSSTNGCTNTDTMTVFVTGGANNPPVAVNDTINLCENDGVTTINVQGNDSDPDGNALTTSISTGALHGLSVLNGNAIVYTPNAGFFGTDTIVYVICDNGTPSLCNTATVIISVNPVYLTNSTASICDGGSIFLAGELRTIAGTYSDTLNSVMGCDSIIKTVLTVNPVYLTNSTASICDGGSIFLAGELRTIAGTYSDTLASIMGCDSIIKTVLTVYPVYITNLSASICDGDSIYIAGAYRFNSGNYTVSNLTINGCDSNFVTHLTVNPLYNTTINLSMCNGDSLFIAGVFRTSAGAYSETLASINGCDSTITTHIVISPLPIAAFSWIATDTLTCLFTNESTNATTSLWHFGDSHNSIVTNPSYTYSSSGSYSVTLIVSNSCGSDSITHNITIINDVPDLEFFNGFSPNGDGYNDFWRIPILNYYSENSVTIVNRWGSEVWKGVNYNNTTVVWTGKNMNDLDLPDGTYYYTIKYNDVIMRGWVFIKR